MFGFKWSSSYHVLFIVNLMKCQFLLRCSVFLLILHFFLEILGNNFKFVVFCFKFDIFQIQTQISNREKSGYLHFSNLPGLNFPGITVEKESHPSLYSVTRLNRKRFNIIYWMNRKIYQVWNFSFLYLCFF